MSLTDDVIKETDKDFVDEIIEYGSQFFSREDLEALKTCMQCGTCVGSCPSGRRTAYRSRVLLRKAAMGLKKEVIEDDTLWNCTTCYTCYERCPRNIKTTDIIRIIRNLTVKEGIMLDRHKNVCNLVFQHGHAVPINAPTKAIRKKLGLDELPPTVHAHPEALEELKELMETTEFVGAKKDKEEAS
jgi:heterodisulfide reductase subunit C